MFSLSATKSQNKTKSWNAEIVTSQGEQSAVTPCRAESSFRASPIQNIFEITKERNVHSRSAWFLAFHHHNGWEGRNCGNCWGPAWSVFGTSIRNILVALMEAAVWTSKVRMTWDCWGSAWGAFWGSSVMAVCTTRRFRKVRAHDMGLLEAGLLGSSVRKARRGVVQTLGCFRNVRAVDMGLLEAGLLGSFVSRRGVVQTLGCCRPVGELCE